jgi:threonine dehydratase
MYQMLRLVELEKSVIEGGGAAGVAALLEGVIPHVQVVFHQLLDHRFVFSLL